MFLVFRTIPLTTIIELLETINWGWLLIALILFVLSQWFSAERLHVILHATDFLISSRSNLKLYIIGMFYNFFIPGGVGGDAFKIYYLNKHFKWSLKKLTAALLLDRGLGLSAILLIISLLLGTVAPVSKVILYTCITIVILFICYVTFIVVQRFFVSFMSAFSKAFSLAFLVQLFQCLSVLCILKSLQVTEDFSIYIIVFLISSMLSFLSLSGIGIREFIFLKAALWLHFDTSTGVAIGLLFTGITAFTSIFGGFLTLNTFSPTIAKTK